MNYRYLFASDRESLLKSIDLSTLYKMREQLGMSNKQIADKLGVSYATILKYIGPQRKRKKS